MLGALVALLGGYEWARLCRFAAPAAWAYGAVAALSVVLLSFAGRGASGIAFLAAAALWVVIVPVWLWRGVRSEHRVLLVATGMVVLVPAALALTVLQPALVLMVLVLVWIADTGAYFVGRAWGRHKLAPSISPGKTWEGAVGGVIAVAAYAIIGGIFRGGPSWIAYLVIGIVFAVMSILGDLFESAVKRQAGAKDSGTLLPGHGGVLDRIDSATAVLPIAASMAMLPRP